MRGTRMVREMSLVMVLVTIALTSALHTPVSAQARQRTLFVSAVDGSGEPVTGLGPEAFDVREDGRRREVLRVGPASEPLDLILLVDNSSAAGAAMPMMRDALRAFVTAMPPDTRLTLVGLADRPTVLVSYTRERTPVTEAIGRLFALPQSGMTLLDGVVETARGLAGRPSARAAMVAVVTDGTEFTNRYARDITRQLEEVQVPLHAVTIGQFDLSHEHAHRERGFLLQDGTRQSGGQWVRLLTPHALEETLQRLARELTSQYEVVYARPETLVPPERVEVASARPGVRMRGAPARGDTGN